MLLLDINSTKNLISLSFLIKCKDEDSLEKVSILREIQDTYTLAKDAIKYWEDKLSEIESNDSSLYDNASVLKKMVTSMEDLSKEL